MKFLITTAAFLYFVSNTSGSSKNLSLKLTCYSELQPVISESETEFLSYVQWNIHIEVRFGEEPQKITVSNEIQFTPVFLHKKYVEPQSQQEFLVQVKENPPTLKTSGSGETQWKIGTTQSLPAYLVIEVESPDTPAVEDSNSSESTYSNLELSKRDTIHYSTIINLKASSLTSDDANLLNLQNFDPSFYRSPIQISYSVSRRNPLNPWKIFFFKKISSGQTYCHENKKSETNLDEPDFGSASQISETEAEDANDEEEVQRTMDEYYKEEGTESFDETDGTTTYDKWKTFYENIFRFNEKVRPTTLLEIKPDVLHAAVIKGSSYKRIQEIIRREHENRTMTLRNQLVASSIKLLKIKEEGQVEEECLFGKENDFLGNRVSEFYSDWLEYIGGIKSTVKNRKSEYLEEIRNSFWLKEPEGKKD